MKMFCLPHAGAFAMRFRGMSKEIAKQTNGALELIVIEYNGRGRKFGMEPYKDFDDMTEQVGDEIAGLLEEDEPYCIFGHCMGGYLAMEVSFYLEKKIGRSPVLLTVSGTATPFHPVTSKFNMTIDETVAYLRSIGGTEEAVMQNKIFEQELLPILKSDLRITHTYQFKHQNQKLNAYLAVTYGEEDFVNTFGKPEEWKMIAGKEIEIRKFPGNHFYYEENLCDYVEFLTEQYGLALQAYAQEKGAYPLTDVQKGYLIGRNAAFASGGVSTHAYYEFRNNLDIDRYEKALNKVIKRHSMLHTIIYPGGYQKEMEDVPYYVIKKKDLSKASEEEKKNYILSRREELAVHIFPAGVWPMFLVEAVKLSEHETYFFYNFDLMIADGGSLRLLLRECIEYYLSPELEKEQLQMTFRDYVLKEESRKYKSQYKKDRQYWMEQLDRIPDPPELPYAKNDSEVPSFQRLLWELDRKTWEKIKQCAMEKQVIPTVLLLTVYASVLSYYTPAKDFCLNITLTNRTSYTGKLLQSIGDFTSLLLLEITSENEEMTFWDKAKALQKKFMQVYMHKGYDGILVEQQIARKRGGQVLYPVVFTSLPENTSKMETVEEAIGEITYSISRTPQVYLDFQLMETAQSLIMTWDYLESRFEEKQIREMFALFQKKMLELAEEDTQEIPYLPALEQSFMEKAEKYNDTDCFFPIKPLHKLFEESAAKYPDRIAVADESGTYTYCELNHKSGLVARELMSKGIGSGCFVGVIGHRNKETIVNLLGILKAGAAYVPLEPTYPKERIEQIKEQAKMDLILDGKVEVSGTEELTESVMPDEKDIAYVIFTSGSTGVPKGVVLSHGAVANTLFSINKRMGIDETDKVLGISSFCFDLSVYDVFGTLAAGAQLVMVPDIHDVENIANLIQKYQVTVWNSVPAIMQLMMDVKDGKGMHSLKNIMLSGDWISPALAERIREKLPNTSLYSLGGATEAAIWSIYYPVLSVEKNQQSIPYGYPLDNQRCYVLDQNGRMCPPGIVGEIVIGGKGVANGYLNRKEQTQKFFRKHPKFGYVYWTGDMGIFHEDGYIEILGRIDGQLKMNGFRIERGEIENRMEKFPHVQRAVVEAVRIRKKVLVGFFVADKKLDKKELEEMKQMLAEYLPAYMVPAQLKQLTELPLNANGKVDRKQLAEIPIELDTENILKPQDEIQQKIFDIFADVSGYDEFGIKDEFSEIGLDSVSILKIISRLNEIFEKQICFEVMMKQSNIAGLSKIYKA